MSLFTQLFKRLIYSYVHICIHPQSRYGILLCHVLSWIQDIVKSYPIVKPEIVKLGPHCSLENACGYMLENNYPVVSPGFNSFVGICDKLWLCWKLVRSVIQRDQGWAKQATQEKMIKLVSFLKESPIHNRWNMKSVSYGPEYFILFNCMMLISYRKDTLCAGSPLSRRQGNARSPCQLLKHTPKSCWIFLRLP